MWWITVALALWLLGMALGQPVRLAGCAASAALLVAIGEAGDWLRRRWVHAAAAVGGTRGPDRGEVLSLRHGPRSTCGQVAGVH
ncbi:hypothetical protein ACFWH1_09030 [Streptomyces sp. NPDC127037]|uniref:hypothetical protein n=1 Tax=Streptomyces sp. NPDC127037 TaxID=3347113 RepID=UPI0036592657